jgi:hypothetical protein
MRGTLNSVPGTGMSAVQKMKDPAICVWCAEDATAHR